MSKTSRKDEKEAVPLHRERPQEKKPDSSISAGRDAVKGNALRNLRIRKRLPVKDMVETVQELYPKYDRYTQSKCEGEYGIELKRDAMQHLMETFAADELEAKARSRHGKHRLTCRITARLEDDEYADLLRYIREDGFDTVQDWLTDTVRQYLLRRRFLT